MELTTREVPYEHEGAAFTGFVVCDSSRTERRPGVLVLHGGAGLDDHARDRATRLARLGYVAFTADLYGDDVRGRRERIMETVLRLRDTADELRARAKAALAQLAAHPLVDGRFAAVGYCFGGLTALEMARDGQPLVGVASIHGSLQTSRPAAPGTMTARVLVCHGALDPHVPTAHVLAFVDEMTATGADWQLNVYGGAEHGFTHEAPPRPGVSYHAVADTRSSAAVAAFLADVLPE